METLDLGDGLKLVRTRIQKVPGDDYVEQKDTWILEEGEDSPQHGDFSVTHYHGSSTPALNHSQIYKESRGKGLGRRVMAALKNYYGGLRSDNKGMTSDDAAKAWRALGAKDRGYDEFQNEKHHGESQFVLATRTQRLANKISRGQT